MKTTFCRTKTADNLRLDGLLFEPDKKSFTGVLHIHGMAGNFYENIFLDSMAEEYTNAGYAFLTVNTSGHDFIANLAVIGETEQHKMAGQIFEKFEDCISDIDTWLNFFKFKGYNRVILQGHSLGAVKVVYYLYKKPESDLSALVIASPPDMLGLARVEAEKKNFERDLAEAKRLVAEGKGKNFLSNIIWNWYYISAETYLNIMADGAKTDVFPILRGGAFEELESVKIPTLAFYGGTDDAAVFSPEKDLEIIKKHLKNEKSKTLLIDTAPHSYFKHEKQTALSVVNWLKEIL
jgi:alpha-beta hydrolase superfamily lysophospholipase